MQIYVPKSKLLQGLVESLDEIKRVVDIKGESYGVPQALSSDDEGSEEEGEGSSNEGVHIVAVAAPAVPIGNIEQVMLRLEVSNEGRFKGRVNPEIMSRHIQKVQGFRQAIEDEVRQLMAHLSDKDDLVKHRPSLKYDNDDRAVFFQVSKNSLALKKEFVKSLKTPLDRKGKMIPDGKVSALLETLSKNYQSAVDDACQEVRDQLKKLCESLQPNVESLLLSAYSSIIARALIEHVDEAKRKGWTLPHLNPHSALPSPPIDDKLKDDSRALEGGLKDGARRMELVGLWPYWKMKEDAVKNDLVLEKTILLTGPNMAGKSTVLRSIAAIALLAACGLAVPGELLFIPHPHQLLISSASLMFFFILVNSHFYFLLVPQRKVLLHSLFTTALCFGITLETAHSRT